MTTVTLNPNGDTYIQSNPATTNNDTVTSLYIGDTSTSLNTAARILIKFDLSSIPSSAVITRVQLQLYKQSSVGDCGLTVLRRVLRDWVSSQATGTIYKTGSNWTTANCGSDGNDRSASASASLTLANADPVGFYTFEDSQLISDVQSFVSGSLPNYGWLVMAPSAESLGTTGRIFTQFASSANATVEIRPQIVIDYSLGGGRQFQAVWWN